ncbi:unnamed protein product, partial [Durusdinium trenchii]
AAYVTSCKQRGIVEGVRGEPWLVMPAPDSLGEKKGPYLALSFGSLTESFYTALLEEPNNENLKLSLTRGLESRLIHHVMSEQCDFIHPRLNNSAVLQNIQHIISSVTTSLWDGVSENEIKLLIVELCKFCVPLLEDNSEDSWVFDTASKKQLVSRLWTIMSGSVVTSGTSAPKRSGKENQQPKKRAKAKANASRSGGGGTALANLQLPEETDVTSTTIKCEVGVRSKLWIDDLLQCVRHSVNSLTKILGVDAVSFDFDSLRSRMLRLGLLFCFTGSVKISTARGCKTHKKWSGLRAALKEYALWQVVQAGPCVCVRE